MRTAVVVFAIGLVAALLGGPQVASQDKSDWADLFAGEFKDWARIGSGKSPWRMTADRTLVCAPAADGLGPKRVFADGTLKFEYRFHPPAGAAKANYKAAVMIRGKAADAWCRLALGDDCGALTASFLTGSDQAKTIDIPGPAGLARTPGEWNEVKVNLAGKAVELVVNGKPAASFVQADAGHTRFVLEAAGSEVEFRNVMWKANK
jgi:hypothetical protein